jgi:hypothetical protein
MGGTTGFWGAAGTRHLGTPATGGCQAKPRSFGSFLDVARGFSRIGKIAFLARQPRAA